MKQWYASKEAVRNQTRFRIPAEMAALVLLAWTSGACAQGLPNPKPSTEPVPVLSQGNAGNGVATCVQPAPMVRIQDYDGPFKKTGGVLAGNLERKAVHEPHYKTGVLLCSLELKDKFLLFVRDSYDPVTILSAGFNAGLSQAQNHDPTFGQGMAGYGKRFAASYADETSFRFFKDFAYPSIFYEDPRYYRLSHGSAGKRFLHAAEHAIVARRDNGNNMFNFSEWLGTASTVALGNLYHPGNQRGFTPAAEQVGFNVAEDIGYDVLREFWPEIARKFKLPFRAEPALDDSDSNTVTK